MRHFKHLFLAALILFLMISAVACTPASTPEEPKTGGESITTEQKGEIPAQGLWKDAVYREDTALGSGKKVVQVEVKADEQSITFTISTDAENLGDALLENKIVEGEEGACGLYIKKVNGILADYDTDSTYWGFFQNGEYMMTGVDSTAISGGEHFELVRTKG